MEVIFNRAKSLRNVLERQLPFERVVDFTWETSISYEDTRFEYAEIRIFTLGFLGERLHAVCYTPITENVIRVISFRKANKRELKFYEKERKKEAANQQTW